MSNDGNQVLLGRLAVHKKLITMEQLVEATREQGRFGNEGQRIGEILVEKGYLNPGQLEQLLVLQRAFLSELSQHAGGNGTAAAPAAKASSGWPPPSPAAAPSAPAAPAFAQAPSSAPSPAAPTSPPPSDASSLSSGLELDFDRTGSGPTPVAPREAPAPAPAPAPAFAPPPAFQTVSPPAFELDFTPPPPTPAAPAALALDDDSDVEAAVLVLEDEDGPTTEPPAPSAPIPSPSAPSPSASRPSSSSSGSALVALSQAPGRADRLDAFLSSAARRGASDVHVHPGAPAKVRVGGALVDASPEPLDPRFCETVLYEALNDAQRALLDEKGQIDFAYAVEGIGRFRANLYRGLTGLNGVFRFVPGFVPSFVQLGLPTELSKLTTFHQGLVLVTGPAGCGKSTTLASLVNIINEERNDHILTIEDPIEYLHPSKRCLVNQRQVNRHTESFGRALRAALREDPDVIVIGELRDLETISLALTAAETGHLVLGTLHTSSAIRTVNRLVGAYPPDEQPQIRAMLSESLRAVLSQRLLPRADGQGRVAALEVLHVNKAVANTVRENKTFQLRSMMQTGRAQGMLLLDQSLQDLVRAGVVSKEEAARHVEDPRFLQ